MRLFRHIYNIFVLAYLDNIVIFSKHKKDLNLLNIYIFSEV